VTGREDPDKMSPELLRAIRARLDEPPPLLALAERHRGQTALAEYLERLQKDRIALVDEVDRLRAELAQEDLLKGAPHGPHEG
jgi:septal ring factor EnvC (AmiA/AmiB activator)